VAATDGRRSGKLTIGAVACILTGALVILLTIIALASGAMTDYLRDVGISTSMQAVYVATAIVPSLIAIVGGYRAWQRRHFWWAIAGAVCSVWSAILLAGYFMGAPVGILAIVLIAMSRKEFA
jgi:small basic protein